MSLHWYPSGLIPYRGLIKQIDLDSALKENPQGFDLCRRFEVGRAELTTLGDSVILTLRGLDQACESKSSDNQAQAEARVKLKGELKDLISHACGLSFNIVSGACGLEAVRFYGKSGRTALKWEGGTVRLHGIRKGLRYQKDGMVVLYPAEKLHGIKIPYSLELRKQKDLVKHSRSDGNDLGSCTKANSFKPGKFSFHGEAMVKHVPLQINYWHAQLELLYGGGGVVDGKSGPGSRICRYAAKHLLLENLTIPQEDDRGRSLAAGYYEADCGRWRHTLCRLGNKVRCFLCMWVWT